MQEKAMALGAATAAKVAEQAPGIASKAMALGAAAASATATAAAGAFESVRDFATDRLKGSHFSDADIAQAAGAMKLLGLGNSDEERLQMAGIILAATLEDDEERKIEGDDA